jgi:hypothetical protein
MLAQMQAGLLPHRAGEDAFHRAREGFGSLHTRRALGWVLGIGSSYAVPERQHSPRIIVVQTSPRRTLYLADLSKI